MRLGGQSINALDFGLAPYVKKSFKKALFKAYKEYLYFLYQGTNYRDEEIFKKKAHEDKFDSLIDFDKLTYTKDRFLIVPYEGACSDDVDTFEAPDYIAVKLGITGDAAQRIYNLACQDVEEETSQAMEAMVHNFNTLHSRAGSQTPFSSVNFGCDTSEEGRLVSDKLLDAIWNGLGHGETAIFPISIFQIKTGINYNPEDPNYDLFKKSMKVSAKRLFPNFVNEDAPYNAQYYKKDNYNSLVAVMGCRTRTMGNINGPEESGSRGNFAFNTINLPYCALQAREEYPNDKDARINRFYELFDNAINLSKEYLEFRYNIISHKKVKNFPFLMQQGVWMDSEQLKSEDEIAPVLKHSSLSIGFCGLAEALVALIGSHHGETEEARTLGLEIIQHLRNITDRFTTETHMNWSTFSTPAESTAGSFLKKCRKKFGVIPGVTDREYFSNSFHCPPYYPIKAMDKIRIEGPYHALCNAGSISYIEMDGDPTKNLKAFEAIVKAMHDANMSYCSVNHAVDRDPVCGYTGIIENECPHCHRKESKHTIHLDRRLR